MAPDTRIADILSLLEFAPFRSTDWALDIGMGDGQITQAVVKRVAGAVGTGLHMRSYGATRVHLQASHIEPVECVAEQLPFADSRFNAVIMAHVLEHCPNVGLALTEVRRMLAPDGWLCIFVPPSEDVVTAGHVSVGWTIGQLLYVLLLHGFNVKAGHFVRLGYNVCAFVQKDDRPLPPLRHDSGDIRTLAEAGRFPLTLKTGDGRQDAFWGNLHALNWPWLQVLDGRVHGPRAEWLRRIFPRPLRRRLGRLALRLGHVLADDEADSVNPTQLRY